jgi:hypothetical protein
MTRIEACNGGVNELLQLLDKAVAIVANSPTLSSDCGHETGSSFAAELQKLRQQVAQNEWSALDTLIAIFAPTCNWDDAVGVNGVKIAEGIVAAIGQLKRDISEH